MLVTAHWRTDAPPDTSTIVTMRSFEVLFDHGEPSPADHPAYGPYGNLGFPEPPPDHPWIFSNFVQSLDGIVSFKGKHAAGADISQSPEDRDRKSTRLNSSH